MALWPLVISSCKTLKVTADKTERMQVNITYQEGTLNAVKQDHPYQLSVAKTESPLCDHLFHVLQKPLHDSLQYLYSDSQVIYTHLQLWPRKLSQSRRIREFRASGLSLLMQKRLILSRTSRNK